MYRTGLVFFFMWIFCFVWQVVKVKLELGFFDDYATFTLICLLMFLAACLNPDFVYIGANSGGTIWPGQVQTFLLG
jgi:hypothetical protein